MAESCSRAFGRYLKTLRERRGLSLDDVSSLSQTFPEKINKGYLSRCENGHQKLAFAKVIPLARIYEVPADVLIERIELDMELDRMQVEQDVGLLFSELTRLGKQSLDQGFKWKAYGMFRASTARAHLDPISDLYHSRDEQVVCAQMNCATAAAALGRTQYALHEYLYLEATKQFGPLYYAVILERISFCYRAHNDYESARRFADAAIQEAEAHRNVDKLGYVYSTRARLALEQNDVAIAVALYRKAFNTYRDVNRRVECAQTLNNLAQCYLKVKRYGAAKRALLASESISNELQQYRSQALTQIMLGEIDAIEDRHSKAEQRWKEASETAKRLNDKVLRFKAEYLLLRQAVDQQKQPVARAIVRRLQKLAPWVPSDTDEIAQFKVILAESFPDLQKSVSA